MRQRDKKSFPHLEGRIIMWKHSGKNSGKIHYVKIAGCDYDIGYSLVNPEDPTDMFTCVNGPLSPNKRAFHGIEEHDIKFQYLLDVVRNNKIYVVDDREDILKQNGIVHGTGKMAACAFR